MEPGDAVVVPADAGHVVHAAEAGDAKLPTGHGAQAKEPGPAANEPAEHCEHEGATPK